MVCYKSYDAQVMHIMFIFIFVPMFNLIKYLYIINSKVVCYTFCQEYEHLIEQPSRILFRAIMQGKNNKVSEPYIFYIE